MIIIQTANDSLEVQVGESNPVFDAIIKQVDVFLRRNYRHKTITIKINDEENELINRGAKLAGYHRSKFIRACALFGCSAYISAKQGNKNKEKA